MIGKGCAAGGLAGSAQFQHILPDMRWRAFHFNTDMTGIKAALPVQCAWQIGIKQAKTPVVVAVHLVRKHAYTKRECRGYDRPDRKDERRTTPPTVSFGLSRGCNDNRTLGRTEC